MMTIKLDQTWHPEGYDDICVRLLVADVSFLMTDEALLSGAMEMLSPQRRAKAEACRNLRVRVLSVGAALALDHLLCEHDLREQDMEYEEGNHGKPAFVGEYAHWDFNLSHSGHMVAAVLAQSKMADVPIGVDIQRVTNYRPELVRRMFSAEDRAQLAACTDETTRQRLFVQLWCRAEAFAKATGEGLRWPFPTPPREAVFHDFWVDEHYCGCLCGLLRKK